MCLSLLTSCGGSRIPDDSKYVVDFPEEICEEMYDVLVCHAAEGKLVKEGKKLYFVDHQNVFHTTVIEKLMFIKELLTIKLKMQNLY
ncbi:MAG: hypothetical protein PUJ29_03280 [bacterium]|nr:hypothetical protein [bacterium]